MKRALACLVTVLLAFTLFALHSDAKKVRVRMQVPEMVSAEKARLQGRVSGRDAVEIQRYARSKERWVAVKRVRASSEGVFRTTVRATSKWERYRAVAGNAQSIARIVPAAGALVTDAPAPTDDCGRRPLKPDGKSYWACTLAQDFDGTELDRTVWRPQTGFPSGSDTGRPCYVDDPSVISVHDGALHLSVRKVAAPPVCPGLKDAPTAHIAGMVSTYRLFSQQYGRFEARIKNTPSAVPGLQEAFWLWPDDRYSTTYNWPASGEIDIAETYSEHPDLAIPFLHYSWNDNGGPKPGVNTAWNCTASRGQWNTFALEWTATRIKIEVNGRTCLVNTSADPAFAKPYIVALTQMMGTASNAYDGRAPLPATMIVDYVRVWK
jgi:beta-glucanase (GH16 family)